MVAFRAAVLALALAACAGPTLLVVREAPPPARVEAVPRARTGYVWVRGDWEWSADGQWRWRAGHWQRSRGNEYTWIDGHWVERADGYAWVEGYWQRKAAGGGGTGRVIVHDHGGR